MCLNRGVSMGSVSVAARVARVEDRSGRGGDAGSDLAACNQHTSAGERHCVERIGRNEQVGSSSDGPDCSVEDLGCRRWGRGPFQPRVINTPLSLVATAWPPRPSSRLARR